MNMNPRPTTYRGALIAAVLAVSLGAVDASAETLEEVVAHGMRTDADAERARLEADMSAYAFRVDSALKDQMREHLLQLALPRLTIAQGTINHRG